MPIQHFAGNSNFHKMSCHVFALSGDPATIDDVNNRYTLVGNYLAGEVAKTSGPSGNIAAGLRAVTNKGINGARQLSASAFQQAAFELLCAEFGLTKKNGSAIRVCGVMKPGQSLPMHMYVIYNGKVYDTVPDRSVLRNDDQSGLNPPSYGEEGLDKKMVFSIGVAALAPGTMTCINTPDSSWIDGDD